MPADGSPGTPYDLDTHPFTAQRVFEGQVVHRDREELADSLVGTDEEDAVEVALAATRFADLVATLPEERGAPVPADRGAVAAATHPVAHRGPRSSSTPGDAGRLLVLASLVPTRDVAWAEITRATSATARRPVA